MAAVRDVALIAVLLTLSAFVLFIVYFVTKVSVNALIVIPAINNSNTQAAYNSFVQMGNTADRFDYLFFSMLIGYILFIIISGYLVGGSPVFMFIYFIVVVISVVFSMVLANAWYDVTTQTIFTTILPGFTIDTALPITNHIMTYLPVYITGIGLLGLLVMFAKPYVSQGGL